MSHSVEHTAGKTPHGIDRHLNMKEKKGTRQFYSISANICLKNKKRNYFRLEQVKLDLFKSFI